MSIADELRKYARGYETMVNHKLLAIAGSIDAEHEKACDDAWNDGYEADFLGIENWLTEHPQVMEHHGWVRLPKDADGEYIHVGDLMEREKARGRERQRDAGTCRADETDSYRVRTEGTGCPLTVHVMECSACGGTYEHVNGSYEFCPRCGRRVVDA